MTVKIPGSEPADVFIAIVTKLTVEIVNPPTVQIEVLLVKKDETRKLSLQVLP